MTPTQLRAHRYAARHARAIAEVACSGGCELPVRQVIAVVSPRRSIWDRLASWSPRDPWVEEWASAVKR